MMTIQKKYSFSLCIFSLSLLLITACSSSEQTTKKDAKEARPPIKSHAVKTPTDGASVQSPSSSGTPSPLPQTPSRESVVPKTPATIADDAFSITLPAGYGTPAKSEQDMPSQAGPLHVVIHTAIAPSSGDVAMVVYNDYPADLASRLSDIAVFFDDVQGGAIKQLTNGAIDGQKDISFEGYPARTLMLAGDQGENRVFVRVLYVFASPRLYQIMLLSGDRNRLTSPEVELFFNGLKIKKKS